MLFIYNHDNQFDKSFPKLLADVNSKSLELTPECKIFTIGPDRLSYLLNIVNDLSRLTAARKFPLGQENYTFYYPHMFRHKRQGSEWGQPATIEALTAPWILIKHKEVIDHVNEGFVLYYTRIGDTVDEFIYLLDTLSHYQLLLSDHPLNIRIVECSNDAVNNFEKAKVQYLNKWGEDSKSEEQLNRIEFGSVTNIVQSFNPMEIGMCNE